MEALSDMALVAQVAVLHNNRAFDKIVLKYQSAVRRFLLNLTLGNEALSDDLAQDTFLKAYTHMAQFRGTASLQTWLFRIAYNVFYDHHRSQKGKQASETLDAASPLLRQRAADSPKPSLTMDIYHALSLLKEEERTCITLQMIEGQPIDQIAKVTGMADNTVKSHLRRGKQRLATFLKQNGYD